MTLKKILYSIICCFMLVSMVQIPIQANEITVERAQSISYKTNKNYIIMEEYLFDAIMKGETSVDISHLNLSSEGVNEINNSPYNSSSVNLRYYTYNSEIVTRVFVDYPSSWTIENLQNYFINIRQKVETVLYETKSMSNIEKILYVHDFLILHAGYDMSSTIPRDSFTSYGILINKKGVCEGYTAAFKYFMDYMGIECHKARSTAMNHVWNIVKFNNSYYHVDVTWDDPINDKLGLVSHTHLLVSDSAMQTKRPNSSSYHHSWSAPVTCTNTSYDNYFWVNVKSPIVDDGTYLYYITYSSGKLSIMRKLLLNGSVSTLNSISTKWYVWGKSSYYTNAYSGLALIDGNLVFNTATDIAFTTTTPNAAIKRYGNQVSTTNGYIYGMRYHEGIVQYTLKQEPNGTDNIYNHGSYVLPIKNFFSSVNSIDLDKGDTYAIKNVYIPYHGQGTVTYSSSNTSVASVSSSGMITANKPGTAKITVKLNNGVTDTINVSVSKPVTGIMLNNASLTMVKGQVASLNYTITPSDASTTVTWSSSNPYVVDVNQNGRIQALSLGTAVITATTSNGLSATCTISVDTLITSIKLNKTSVSIKEKEKVTLTATLSPSNATNKTVTWTSSNPEVATVNNGVVTGLKIGTAIITAKAATGITTSCTVTVTLPFTDVNEKKWYYSYVKEAYELGLMTGTTNTTFAPDGNMTRGMVAVVMHRIAGTPTYSYRNIFPDVPAKKYCATAITWAFDNEIITGFKSGENAGKFLPDGNITRQDLALILYRYATSLGIDTSGRKDISTFVDHKEVSKYARDAMEWVTSVGIITGTKENELKPQANATRAECAKMLVEFYKLINK